MTQVNAPLQKAIKAQEDNKSKVRSEHDSSTSHTRRGSRAALNKQVKDEKSNVCVLF